MGEMKGGCAGDQREAATPERECGPTGEQSRHLDASEKGGKREPSDFCSFVCASVLLP